MELHPHPAFRRYHNGLCLRRKLHGSGSEGFWWWNCTRTLPCCTPKLTACCGVCTIMQTVKGNLGFPLPLHKYFSLGLGQYFKQTVFKSVGRIGLSWRCMSDAQKPVVVQVSCVISTGSDTIVLQFCLSLLWQALYCWLMANYGYSAKGSILRCLLFTKSI